MYSAGVLQLITNRGFESLQGRGAVSMGISMETSRHRRKIVEWNVNLQTKKQNHRKCARAKFNDKVFLFYNILSFYNILHGKRETQNVIKVL